MMTVEAHAKINWTLQVLGKRPDGYHELKSVVIPVALCDQIEIEETETISAADFPYGECDLAYRAAVLLKTRSGYSRGARIHLEKRIPAGAGLGGGSADAAAVLNGLNRLWRLEWPMPRLLELAAEIGSDVPALTLGGAVMMEGRGERVRKLTAVETATIPAADSIELWVPPIFSSTAAVYGEYRESDKGQGRNDLQPAALRLYPEIAEALRELEARGLKSVAMSGSGSAVYGVRATGNG